MSAKSIFSGASLSVAMALGVSGLWAVVELASEPSPASTFAYLFLVTFAITQFAQLRVRGVEKGAGRISDVDPLTGVLNYSGFRSMAERFLLLGIRNNHDFAIVICDVDEFSEINRGHDHEVGNELLSQVSEVLRQNTRKSDVICRYTDDKFIVCLPETNLDGATMVSEKIRESVDSKVFEIAGNDIKTTVSIGVSVLSQKAGASLDDLIESADTVLSRAKQAGRNQVVIAEERDFPQAEGF